MIKVIDILTLIVFFDFYTSYSQNKKENNLFMVMACSTDLMTQRNNISLETDTSILSILWMLDKDTLIAIDTLNFDYHLNNEILEVRHFDEFNFFFLKEREKRTMKFLESLPYDTLLPDKNIYISVLDYGENNLVLRKRNSKYFKPFFDYYGSGTSYLHKDTLYYGYTSNNNDKYFGAYVINKWLKKGKKREDSIYMNNIYAKYEPNLIERDYSGFPFSKKGKLVYNSLKECNFNLWKEIDFQVPHSSEDGIKYSNFGILLNTPSSKYLIGKKNMFRGATDTNKYFIMNKYSEKWDSFYLPTGYVVKDMYKDDFIYSTIEKNSIFPNNNYIDSIEVFKIRNKDKYNYKYGYYPNITLMSGKFFIYHIPTKKFIEYRAKDRDCEVIQILDDWIYYRVYDEFRRMKLDTEKVEFLYSTDELLYKDRDIIPNVHHIFFAKKQPLKVEWITPKPENKSKSIKIKK